MYFALMGKLNARRKNLAEQDDKGFTLIELLVVVIIIGILAAIAIPVYLGVQKNAQDSATQSDVANLKTAVVSIQTNMNAMPAGGGITDLTAKPASVDGKSTSTQSWADAGATSSGNNTSMTLYSTASAFCVVGISKNNTTYFATDTAGATKVAGSVTLPANCK